MRMSGRVSKPELSPEERPAACSQIRAAKQPYLPPCQKRLAEFSHRVAKTAHNAFLSEDDHGVKKRRRDGLSNDGDANRVDEQAGLHAAGFSNRAGRMIAQVVAPFRKCGEGVGSLSKQFLNFGRLFPEFFFCSRITLELVGEKRPRPGRKVGKQPDTRAQQINGS